MAAMMEPGDDNYEAMMEPAEGPCNEGQVYLKEEVDKHGPTKKLKLDAEGSIYSSLFDACISDVAKTCVTEKEFEQLLTDSNLVFFLQVVVMGIIFVKMPTDDYVEPTDIQMGLRLAMCFLYHYTVSPVVSSAYKRLKFLSQNIT